MEAIIPPRVLDIRKDDDVRRTYRIVNCKMYRIKSRYDNKMMLSTARVNSHQTEKAGRAGGFMYQTRTAAASVRQEAKERYTQKQKRGESWRFYVQKVSMPT